MKRGRTIFAALFAVALVATACGGAGSGGTGATTAAGLQKALDADGLTVLDPADATDQNGFVVTKDTASSKNLKKLSDLAPVAKDMILGGPPECPQRPFCQLGLKNVYGLTFKDFK